MTVDIGALRASISKAQPPFSPKEIGHGVLMASDIYGDNMMPGSMVFMRCNVDHHDVALIGGAAGPPNQRGLHHTASAAGTGPIAHREPGMKLLTALIGMGTRCRAANTVVPSPD